MEEAICGTTESIINSADMYHRVPEYFPTVSERISNILDVIDYSQEDRDRKVSCATGWEVFICMSSYLIGNLQQSYMNSSRGEGSTGPGLHSDQDVLIHQESIKVVTDISECHTGMLNYLMVKDVLTHSGYVKLQRVSILPDNTAVPAFFYPVFEKESIDAYGRVVLLNSYFHILSTSTPGHVIHGPAIHTRRHIKETSLDMVPAIKCTQWPNEANEWFQRRRLHGWPKVHHIQNAEKDGCFAVAVGHPCSSEEDLEWRLSFSLTERKITRSFEDTVMKLYILLKMIKKTYIEPYLDDAFSSYHCKVCILWMREKTPPELWRTENLLHCLVLCIKQLYEWATIGYCPDYFIVTNNIYDRKIVGQAQLMLIQILGVLLSEDCRFLLGLECCNLGQLLFNACSNLDITTNISSINIWTDIFTEKYLDYVFCIGAAIRFKRYMLSHIPQEYNILSYYIRSIMHALQHAHHTLQIYLHNILMTLLSRLGFYVISVCKENAHSLSQEEVDCLVAFASRCLSLGINSDASSVRLKLCGLATMLGDYDLTEICLQHISDHKMRILWMGALGADVCMYTPCCNFGLLLIWYCTERCSIEQALLNHMSFNVVYLLSETSITPTALRMEMFRSIGAPLAVRDKKEHFWYEWAVVDSCMCLYFFQYMNFLRLGKERHQQAAMDSMINVIRIEPETPHRDTELNLLGYCFMQEAQPRNAFICFYNSLKIRPHHNAAKFYLAILFHKVRVARGRRENC